MYHRENAQEDFLVLGGECLLIVDGEERPLRQWDYFHCPPGVDHAIVGAGEGPSLVLAVGARTGSHAGSIVYPADPAALQHGAGVEVETADPRDAYAPFTLNDFAYGEELLPGSEFRRSWPSRRTSCTRRWTSSSRGPSARCPSTCARSTSTACTRTTGSSSRSSSRCCSTATSRAARTCSIRSPARGRRSCRRSSRGSTRPASSSRRSTAC